LMPSRPRQYRPPGSAHVAELDRRRYERQAWRQEDKAFYSAPRWRKLRAAFLAHHPLCAECDRHGRTTLAEHVHHVLERKARPELAYDWDNLESLCESCHSRHATFG